LVELKATKPPVFLEAICVGLRGGWQAKQGMVASLPKIIIIFII